MIEIKRNCSSSIRQREDSVSYGDFTIVISGKDYAIFEKILSKYKDKATALGMIIGQGIFSEYWQSPEFYDDPEA